MIKDIFTSSRRKAKDARNNWRVKFNGTDITYQTYYADSRRGIVRVNVRDENGYFYASPDGEIVRAEWRGRVRLIRRKGRKR